MNTVGGGGGGVWTRHVSQWPRTIGFGHGDNGAPPRRHPRRRARWWLEQGWSRVVMLPSDRAMNAARGLKRTATDYAVVAPRPEAACWGASCV